MRSFIFLFKDPAFWFLTILGAVLFWISFTQVSLVEGFVDVGVYLIAIGLVAFQSKQSVKRRKGVR
jgi:hypothetical protein